MLEANKLYRIQVFVFYNGVARKNPLGAREIAVCREMQILRTKLRLSITGLANLLAMSLAVLQSRENATVPWQPGEIKTAKKKIAEHLSNGAKALAALDD